MTDEPTDAQLAEALRAIRREFFDDTAFVDQASTCELAARRLAQRAAGDHGTPAVTINEHAHGDDGLEVGEC